MLRPLLISRPSKAKLLGIIRELFQGSSRTVDVLQQRYILLCMLSARIVIISILLGVTAWKVYTHSQYTQFSLEFLFWPIALIYAVSVLNWWLLKKDWKIRLISYGQLVLDLVLATFAIYITNSSAGLIIYLLSVVAAGFLFQARGAVLMAALSGLFYAIVTSGLVNFSTATVVSVSPLDILGVYLTLVFIALLTGIVEKHVSILTSTAAQHEQTIAAFHHQHRQLFDDLAEGIITTDLNYIITGINKTARKLLDLTKVDTDYMIGYTLTSVLQRCGIDPNSISFEVDPVKSFELSVTKPGASAPIMFSYSLRYLTDSFSEPHGIIFMINDISHLKSIEERLSIHEQMTKLLENSTISAEWAAADHPDNYQMIGESNIIKQVLNLVGRVAQSDASVLITGESGTGKELIARAIHHKGPRKNKPFIAVNCGAIPENLIESELFGHKKGSFTGAVSDHPGLFRQANNGTLFLDEIAELPLALQAKLLRVIQDKRVRAVGDVHDYPIDVRLISATNRDLRKEIKQNTFREDLYYRLNVVNIVTPPLRERKEDIPLLVRYFVGRHSDADQVLPKISPEAMQTLVCYNFPGNIRELENIIERALVLGGHAILPEHLPPEVMTTVASKPFNVPQEESNPGETTITVLPIDLEELLSRIERDYLIKALERTHGIKKHAAELLGLNFRSFRYRLKKYNMHDDQSGDDSQ